MITKCDYLNNNFILYQINGQIMILCLFKEIYNRKIKNYLRNFFAGA